MNRYRKFVTSGVGFTFVVVGVTGVVFKFFFKNHPLEEVHGWIGLAMVAAAVLHIGQNWGSLRSHLRDWRVYLLLVPIVLVFVLVAVGQREEGGRGNPRAVIQKLAQGRVNDVARAFGKDANAVMATMRGDGLQVGGGDQTVAELARQNQQPPDGILTYFAR